MTNKIRSMSQYHAILIIIIGKLYSVSILTSYTFLRAQPMIPDMTLWRNR
jgi:hypothetical protein